MLDYRKCFLWIIVGAGAGAVKPKTGKKTTALRNTDLYLVKCAIGWITKFDAAMRKLNSRHNATLL